MKIISLFLMIFLVSACQPDKEAAISEPEGEILKIQKVTSKSGITAWLVEDASHPIVAMRFTFKGAGARNENEATQGTAKLLSHTMDEGAGDLDSQAFQKALTDHSIALRFSSGRDNFGGRLKTLSRHKDKAFALLTMALNEPRFDEEAVERMRQANISRIKSSKGDPNWIQSRLVNDILYEGHPYALNSGGTLSTLPKITPDDLHNYKEAQLTQDRLLVSVTGDISAEELAQRLDQIFSSLPETAPVHEEGRFTLKNAGKTFIYDKDIPQTVMAAALPSFRKSDPDYFAYRVMNALYGESGFGSRLMEEAREKRGLTYGIYSSRFHYDQTEGLSISTSTKNDSAAEMIEIIKAEMETMKQDIAEEDLAPIKSYMTGSLMLSLTSTDKIAGTLQDMQISGYETDYLDRYAGNINAVTAGDVKRVAERILKPDLLTVIMVGQPVGIENAIVRKTLPNVD